MVNWGTASLSQSLTTQTFTQPALTKNGSLGGSGFAVAAENVYSSSYPAYYAFDNNSSTRFGAGAKNCYVIIYNPNPLKITKLVTVATSNSWGSIQSLTIQGSNDNTTYTNITCSLSDITANQTITVSNSNFYKYYKLNLVGYSDSHTCELYSITITATEQVSAAGGTDTIYLPQAHSAANYVPLLSFVGTSGKYAQQHYFSAVKASYFTLKSTTTGNTVMRYITVGY